MTVISRRTPTGRIFTHNIVHITDTLDLTLGLRYTKDKKNFNATFGNDNTVCTAIQGLVIDDLTNPLTTATARALAGALIGLGCQGNSTAELNGVSINDSRSEDRIHRHRDPVVETDRRSVALYQLCAWL